MIWVMLVTGILLGWIIEWIIDTYRYNRMVERLQNEHSQAIMDVTNRYEAAMEEGRLTHEERLNELRERQRTELNIAEVEYNTRISEHTAAHRQELEANQTRLQNELSSRDTSYAEAKNVLEQGYSEEVSQLKLEHEQQLMALRGTHSEESSNLEIRIRSEYEDQLSQVEQNSVSSTQQQIGEHDTRLKRDFDYALEQNNAQHHNEVIALKADYEQRIDELTLLARSQTISANTSSNAATSSLSGNGIISHVKADDLTIIEGIGPKANNLLHDGGINSYDDLAHANVGTLQHILDDAGPRFRLLTPDTWPQQASLAAEGNWDALDQFKDQLDGGKPAS
ncbi:MAG: hypothetical protein JKY90_01610 [Gammaproteobacteria bacterium]|nr:hypothetical protein [Gammaproteobacteria bacterium]